MAVNANNDWVQHIMLRWPPGVRPIPNMGTCRVQLRTQRPAYAVKTSSRMSQTLCAECHADELHVQFCCPSNMHAVHKAYFDGQAPYSSGNRGTPRRQHCKPLAHSM